MLLQLQKDFGCLLMKLRKNNGNIQRSNHLIFKMLGKCFIENVLEDAEQL